MRRKKKARKKKLHNKHAVTIRLSHRVLSFKHTCFSTLLQKQENYDFKLLCALFSPDLNPKFRLTNVISELIDISQGKPEFYDIYSTFEKDEKFIYINVEKLDKCVSFFRGNQDGNNVLSKYLNLVLKKYYKVNTLFIEYKSMSDIMHDLHYYIISIIYDLVASIKTNFTSSNYIYTNHLMIEHMKGKEVDSNLQCMHFNGARCTSYYLPLCISPLHNKYTLKQEYQLAPEFLDTNRPPNTIEENSSMYRQYYGYNFLQDKENLKFEKVPGLRFGKPYMIRGDILHKFKSYPPPTLQNNSNIRLMLRVQYYHDGIIPSQLYFSIFDLFFIEYFQTNNENIKTYICDMYEKYNDIYYFSPKIHNFCSSFGLKNRKRRIKMK